MEPNGTAWTIPFSRKDSSNASQDKDVEGSYQISDNLISIGQGSNTSYIYALHITRDINAYALTIDIVFKKAVHSFWNSKWISHSSSKSVEQHSNSQHISCIQHFKRSDFHDNVDSIYFCSLWLCHHIKPISNKQK